jgi:hypothetical protein
MPVIKKGENASNRPKGTIEGYEKERYDPAPTEKQIKKMKNDIIKHGGIKKYDSDSDDEHIKSKPTKKSVKSKIKSSIKDIQKNQIENLIKDVKNEI